MIWRTTEIKEWDVETEVYDGSWVPARPDNLRSLIQVMREIWLVATGKGDVLVWTDKEDADAEN